MYKVSFYRGHSDREINSDESRTITHSTKVVRRHGDGNVGSTPTAVRELPQRLAGGSGRTPKGGKGRKYEIDNYRIAFADYI